MVNDFIFELGCEELPSGAVKPLAQEFTSLLLAALDKSSLKYGEVKSFATPRRMALTIKDLQDEQPNQTLSRKGPALSAAYDNEGKPSSALLGFAKSCGVGVDELKKTSTDKGEWVVYEAQTQGAPTKKLLPVLISQCLTALTIPKPMRWGDGDDEFIRPVHWAVLMYGTEVINQEIFGIKTGDQSRGHRFHHPQTVKIESAQSYESQMRESFVIADFEFRRQIIKEEVQKLAKSYNAQAVMPEALLDEVTSIVEWPKALLAHFEKEFLEVPSEALIASMQVHQKTFALIDSQGALLPHFITVSNIDSSSPSQVIQGNEKVMRARLSDAAFFFNLDRKKPLEHLIPATQQVVFQTSLGSLHLKTLRIEALMSYLCSFFQITQDHAKRAAQLCKCDLLTGMVGEFPELQGIMGYYYALNDAEPQGVAQAIKEHYMPRFAADELPKTDLGRALSLADRMDTLVGIFAIGQKPSGVKDPFKLRRHALAVVRLLTDKPCKLNLSDLIEESIRNYSEVLDKQKLSHVTAELKPFILERMHSYYLGLGIQADVIQAVKASQDECLYDLDKRLTALTIFIKLPEAASLSAACKRVNNLLSSIQIQQSDEVDQSLLIEKAEKNLYEQIKAMSIKIEPLYKQTDYEEILKLLASLKDPIDAFFDQVMIMVEDKAIKQNRLAILSNLQSLLQGVAQISLLH